MPVISRFNGIIIKMYLKQREHNPPHIHAICNDKIGIFSLIDGEMLEGDLSINSQKAIREFIEYYRLDLLEMWETQKFKKLSPI